MTRRLLALTFVFVVSLCSTAVAGSSEAVVPEAGAWDSEPAAARGGVADLSFTVDPVAGTLAGKLSYGVARCGWSETVEFTGVAVSGGRFKLRHKARGARRAKIDLRLEGVFDSEFEAHGTLRGKIKLRGRGKRGRGAVVCKLPKLTWTAELVEPAAGEDEPVEDPYADEPSEDDTYADEPVDDEPVDDYPAE
jgi:hypothetical protein